jgi:hypothetical protein
MGQLASFGPTERLSRSQAAAGAKGLVALPAGLVGALPRASVPLDGLGTSSIDIQAVELGGLETVSAWSLLRPRANNTLASTVGARRLQLRSAVELGLALNQSGDLRGPPLVLRLEAGLSLPEDWALGFALQVGVDRAAAMELNINQLTDSGCLLPLLRELGLPVLSLKLGAAPVISLVSKGEGAGGGASPLLQQLVSAVGAAVGVLAEAYGNATIAQLLAAAVEGPGQLLLDGVLRAIPGSVGGSGRVCGAQPSPFTTDLSPPDPRWVSWGAMPGVLLLISAAICRRHQCGKHRGGDDAMVGPRRPRGQNKTSSRGEGRRGRGFAAACQIREAPHGQLQHGASVDGSGGSDQLAVRLLQPGADVSRAFLPAVVPREINLAEEGAPATPNRRDSQRAYNGLLTHAQRFGLP